MKNSNSSWKQQPLNAASGHLTSFGALTMIGMMSLIIDIVSLIFQYT